LFARGGPQEVFCEKLRAPKKWGWGQEYPRNRLGAHLVRKVVVLSRKGVSPGRGGEPPKPPFNGNKLKGGKERTLGPQETGQINPVGLTRGAKKLPPKNVRGEKR